MKVSEQARQVSRCEVWSWSEKLAQSTGEKNMCCALGLGSRCGWRGVRGWRRTEGDEVRELDQWVIDLIGPYYKLL